MPVFTQDAVTFGAATPVALDGGTVIGPLTVTGATGITGATTVTGTFGVTGAGSINQSSTTGAVAVATLTQADTDQPFMDVVGTSGTLGTQSISTTTTATANGHIMIAVNGTPTWLRTYGTPA